ncbi:MAG: hypothetical protein GDA47_02720 [Rhodospirillales bacterium]|nr:hypothetical protein [Rhodospirillales bacterium]
MSACAGWSPAPSASPWPASTKTAIISGFAGCLIAQHTSFISPDLLHWTTSGEILAMVIVGGLGTLVGPLIGVILVVVLKYTLGGYTDYWQFWLGLALIAVVLSGRNGLVGALEELCLLLLRRLRPERRHA